MADDTDKRDPETGAAGAGDRADDDATEINPEGEYTEFRSATQTSAGFDHARQLARKAHGDSGRLLKKRFVLEDVLGEGGMGLVYKARDLRKVEAEDRNPYIAVKVLGQNFKDHPQAFVSLQQEAVKSQKLAHPNIVTVHDFDRDGDTIFMTMELLKGDPLDSLLRLEAPFSKEVALRYFNDLCAGLDYAHKRGLIHSDFKPGNIFVTTGGTVKILDFGIARAASKGALSHDYDAGELGALTPPMPPSKWLTANPQASATTSMRWPVCFISCSPANIPTTARVQQTRRPQT
ncbi:serine/threonine-protein kinase [Kineobactrum salinum]|uniref:Serine/threonine protein kinase n=1 Tax=Kineobactrum salinum TaxID=2708301 RepID=A0A6C0U4G5_9GAMM|nr:serine/threonine-protein kinase [Kineobactrum salinum]QIB67050.1 serine/threonine protein kinase [Kineobactrum salinum]